MLARACLCGRQYIAALFRAPVEWRLPAQGLGFQTCFGLSRAIRAAERGSSENLVDQNSSLYSAPRAPFPWLPASGTCREARKYTSSEPAFYLCVRENRTSSWNPKDRPVLQGPESATHATSTPGGHIASLGYPAPFLSRLHSRQGAQAIQGGPRCSNPHFRPFTVQCELSGWETYRYTL